MDIDLLSELMRKRLPDTSTADAGISFILTKFVEGQIDIRGLIQETGVAGVSNYSMMAKLFSMVHLSSASQAQMHEAGQDKMLNALISIINNGFFVIDLGKVAAKHIQESSPYPHQSPGIWRSASGWPYDMTQKPAQIHWLNRLAEKSNDACLRLLVWMRQTHWAGARTYFDAFEYKQQMLDISDSKKAFRLYKNFGWNECIPYLREADSAYALELDLGL